MDYFYLKVGRGNGLVRDLLAGAQNPSVQIFFDSLTRRDYDAGQGAKEPREFVWRGEPEFHDRTLMVVVHDGEIWVLRPTGRVEFLPETTDEEGRPLTPKQMPVEIVAQKSCKDVPPVLAGIGANQYYARGTFRQINDWGNFKAIDWVAGRVGQGDHWKVADNGPDQLLECLGSTEIETLVAKLLEDCGFFVPAYLGGVLKDIDLFAHNDSDEATRVGPITVAPRGGLSVQVKRWAWGMQRPSCVDLLVGIGVSGPRTLGAAELLALLDRCPNVRRWLGRSLRWLPEELLLKFNLLGEGSGT